MGNDTTIERYISQKARDAMPASDFAGHGTDFPIPDQAHLDAAVKDMGRETPEYQAFIKKNIIRIAKRKGLTLPQSWEDDDKTEERMAGTTTEQPTSFRFYAPFVRIDGEQKDKREVLGKATRGTPIDTYDTVITYEASKRAFERAKRIPLREMHQPKAVGKGLEWWGDDSAEDIYLHSYISRGAEDTWTKVQEDVLVGYSIKGEHAKYGTIQRNGKTVTAIVDYDLVEVSLVDNPSCPGCDIAIMRADGIEQTVLASDEELADVFQRAEATESTPPAQPAPPTEIERKSVAISADNRDKIHASRDALTSMCAGAGCTDCQAMMDFASGGSDTSDEDVSDAGMQERVAGIVTSAMAPVYARMQAMLGQFSRAQQDTSAIHSTITELSSAIERVAGKVEALAGASILDEVRRELSDVKGQIERIAKTPLPGGPHTGRISNGKTLATDGPASTADSAEHTPEIMRQLAQSGVTLTPQQSAMLVASTLKRI